MSQLQRTGATLSLNGLVCNNLLSIEIVQSSYVEAGRLRASVVLQRNEADKPLWTLVETAVAAGSPVSFTVQIGSSSDVGGALVFQPVMTGTIDMMSLDVARGLLELEGRDSLSRLGYISPSPTFVNQTSSQIIESVGQSAGLETVVTPTSTIVGQYYQIEHAHGLLTSFSRFSNALDLVAFLARLECYDCWVSGNTLYFQPRATASAASYLIDLSTLVPNTQVATTYRRLRLDRRLSPDANAPVLVRSWNNRQRAVIEASYPSQGGTNPNVFIVPNLSSDAALTRAQAIFSDLSAHRQVLSGEMVGDLSLQPRTVITVQGSPGWDGNYVVDEVIREMNPRSGFEQSFVARIL